MSVVGIISWIIFGLVAGLVARAIHPGRESMGTMMTIVLGIAGAVAGGFIASLLNIGGNTDAGVWNLGHFLVAVVGAIILLALYNLLSSGRARA